MRDKYIKSQAINAAITIIQREEFTDYANAAKHFKYSRPTIS
jgi:hypothetical protein